MYGSFDFDQDDNTHCKPPTTPLHSLPLSNTTQLDSLFYSLFLMLHKKHKDILVRIIAGLIGAGYIAYIISLIQRGATSITTNPTNNMIILGLLIVIGIVFLIHVLYRPLIQKRIRLTMALIGAVIIILGHYVLHDNPEARIYLSDITKIFGVIILIGGATGLLIPADVVAEIQESKVEIIEA